MDLPATSHRCPQCQALVVDRRAPLPAGWIMTPEQAAKVTAIDKVARAEHTDAMKMISNAPYTLPIDLP